MDFTLDEQQRLLQESVSRLLADHYSFAARKQHAAGPDGWSRAMWGRFAELGLLGLPFAEEEGGFGGGAMETAIVMEAFGDALVVEPYFATVVLAGGLLRALAPRHLRQSLVPEITSGHLHLAFAQQERGSREDLADIVTMARRDGAAWRIDGAKSLVLHGELADHLLVTARSAGGRRDREGIGLFLVAGDAKGMMRRGYPTQDGMRAAEISFAGAQGIPLGDPGDALPAIERVVDGAVAALAAEAVGLMAAMHAQTLDYLRTRKQFGRAIGEFQALQHRAVDMYVALELARSMALYAAMMAESDDAAARHQACAAAKVQIGRSGRLIAEDAVQLHGGIGMTMEYALGHYVKRMTMIEHCLGSADHHLGVLAGLGLDA